MEKIDRLSRLTAESTTAYSVASLRLDTNFEVTTAGSITVRSSSEIINTSYKKMKTYMQLYIEQFYIQWCFGSVASTSILEDICIRS